MTINIICKECKYKNKLTELVPSNQHDLTKSLVCKNCGRVLIGVEDEKSKESK